jgi:rhodanese-related sulfurtransferase
MPIPTITALQASEKMASGAICIDIRESCEFQREHIDGAICVPFEQLIANGLSDVQKNRGVIFSCKSGWRTKNASKQLAELAENGAVEIYLLDNGLNGWKSAGFTVIKQKTVLPIMRQVQIAAGSLVLLGMLLGSAVNPLFYLLSTFVGAGLVFAGITGFCGMAVLLGKMPWNK